MTNMWQMLSNYEKQHNRRPFKRVITGPMGIGKTCLAFYAFYLAARTYTEGWLILYIPDASVLVQDLQEESSEEICQRFLSINRDILTATELKDLVKNVRGKSNVATSFVNALWGLIRQQTRKTLLVVDEHRALFESESPTPIRFPVLRPLLDLSALGGNFQRAHVILTGISHEKFEGKYLKGEMQQWIEFVEPIQEHVLQSLVGLHPHLGSRRIRSHMGKITNNIPGELKYLDVYVGGYFVDVKLGRFHQNSDSFFPTISTSLKPYSQMDHYIALSSMFLGRPDRFRTATFDWKFLDTGLVYQLKDEQDRVMYKALCPAALDALQIVYSSLPLPRDVTGAFLLDTQLTDHQFEAALLHQLLRYRFTQLETTGSNGKSRSTISLEINRFINIEDGVIFRN
ncbi:hypothetical protein BGX26_004662 [Mortierella sp. AD094]|nr:hypothetical protein BGX26_004662 [Mortierella sp. AD094]